MSDLSLRPFRSEDAGGVAEIVREAFPYLVTNADLVRFDVDTTPERAKPLFLVAENDGLVGWAAGGIDVYVSNPGVCFARVAVAQSHRGKGIGSALYSQLESHLLGTQPNKIRGYLPDSDAASRAFAERRGFEKKREAQAWMVEPSKVDLSGLDELEEKRGAEGYRVTNLGSLRDRPKDVFEMYRAGVRDIPSNDPYDITYEDWEKVVWNNPGIDDEGSMVVVDDDRPVSFAFLLIDREGGRAYHDLTGTVPDQRRKGLARLAKMAGLRWAAGAGIKGIFTDNDSTNADMLAINEHLGYKPGHRWLEMAKELEGQG